MCVVSIIYFIALMSFLCFGVSFVVVLFVHSLTKLFCCVFFIVWDFVLNSF